MKKNSIDFGDIKKKRRKKTFIIRGGIGAVILGLLIFGVVRIVFYSSLFRIQDVVVNSGDISKEKILDLLRDRIEKNSFLIRSLGFNNFLAWPKNIEGSELAAMPEIDNLIIKKEYSRKALTVDVISKKPFALWCLKKDLPASCYLFDKNGYIFGKSPEAGGNLIQVVSDYSQDSLNIGSKILKNELVPNMISILETLSASGLALNEISLKDLTREEIDIQTSAGPIIYFSLHYPAETYLSFIQSLLPSSATFKNIQYIDLRVPNRAYYK